MGVDAKSLGSSRKPVCPTSLMSNWQNVLSGTQDMGARLTQFLLPWIPDGSCASVPLARAFANLRHAKLGNSFA